MAAKTNGRLADRKILITGAGSGVGKATAELFAAEGAKLALLDINEQAVKSVGSAARRLDQHGSNNGSGR